MKNFIKLSLVISILCMAIPMVGQTFPNYFPLGNYDMAKGRNSYLRWINDDADTPSSPYNDAIIFATSVNASDNLPKDMLRLTIAGVATFNSPFPGYSQSIELRNQGTLDGRLRISGTMLDIEGQSAVNIGTISNPFLFQINNQRTVCRTAFELTGYENTLWLGLDANRADGWIGTKSNTNLKLGVNSVTALTVENGSHNVYVGVSDSEISTIPQNLKSAYSLFVKKGILSEDYSIAPVSSWADFVFDNTYKLKPLSEVEKYIQTNKHLPDVPSEEEVSKEGYSQHDLNKALLQKIEELTLYVIKQDKEINALKTKIDELTK